MNSNDIMEEHYYYNRETQFVVGSGEHALHLQKDPHDNDWPTIYRVSVIKNKKLSDFKLECPYEIEYYCHYCALSHITYEIIISLTIQKRMCNNCKKNYIYWAIDDLSLEDVGITSWYWQFRCNKCKKSTYAQIPLIYKLSNTKNPVERVKHLIADSSISELTVVLE